MPYNDRFGQRRSVNAYFLSDGKRGMLVDTGLPDAMNEEVLLKTWHELGSPRIDCILLTHGHTDHTGNAASLAQAFGAEVMAHSAALETIARRGATLAAKPSLADGLSLVTPLGSAVVLHTPGHSPGDVSIYFQDSKLLIAGDVVLSRSSTLIGPPEGDMSDYLASLRRLLTLDVQFLAPGHGPIILDGWRRVLEALEHRIRREGEVLALVRYGVGTEEAVAAALYGDGDRAELGGRLVNRYLLHLAKGGRIQQVNDAWHTTSSEKPR